MPSMPRRKGKATKIAYSILGDPINVPMRRKSRQRQHEAFDQNIQPDQGINNEIIPQVQGGEDSSFF